MAIISGDEAPGLFDRLPLGIFGPLSSEHAPRYMRILTRLHDDFFGPDGEVGNDDGFPRRRITQAIEAYLRDDPWPTMDGEDRATPVEIQAHEIFGRLTNAGWLDEEHVDVRVIVTVKPAVRHFLFLLLQFAERGPVYIGGAVQVIFNQLQRASEDPAGQAQGFHVAAQEARSMIEALAATKVRAKEAIERLAGTKSVAEFAEMYFEEYVNDLYIGDYHRLRTTNHPLRHRYEIIALVTELREDPVKREALLSWYRENQKQLRIDPEAALERDVALFMRFNSIEQHLDRLDSAMNRVNTQALNYFRYATRARGQIETLLDDAIKATIQRGATRRGPYLFTGLPFSETRLKLPKERVEGDMRVPVLRKLPSPRMLATYRLNQIMRSNRQITNADLEEYIARNAGSRGIISSDELKIISIKDFCVFLALERLGVRDGHAVLLNGKPLSFRVRRDEDTITYNEYIAVPRFVVERSQAMVPQRGHTR